ncbi:uncharacterized protein LOC133677489 [Populus nigra]|uniref:uncharacterized protein LOC133677489 n=1 Tax=Populus nigra TaxID=3691 RepID=UPI002B2703DE|nr:uncharacterized protein LOC133677489 [Populus nigra]
MSQNPNLQKQAHNPSSGSLAERVRVTDTTTRFSLDPIPRQSCGTRLSIPEELLTDSSEKWTRCMVGFCPGFKMNYHIVNMIATRAWKNHGLENVMTTAGGFMIFRFNIEAAMHDVLEKGPWMFGGKAIILQQWHPHFVFDKNKISKLPVWIRLHGLPFPLWSKAGLSLIASMAGRPLSCDEQTYNCTRLDYARVCIEIDAALPLIHQFEIETPLFVEPIMIQVEYEWKPPRCGKCCLFGHVCPSVPSLAPTVKGKEICEPTTSMRIPPAAVNTPRENTFMAPQVVTDTLPPVSNEHALNIPVSKVMVQHLASPASTSNSDIAQPPEEASLLHIIPYANPILATAWNDNCGSDQESTHDPQHMEDCQHLLTGFSNCMENRMASLTNNSNPLTDTTESSLDASFPQGTTSSLQVKKKKGKKSQTKIAPANLNTVTTSLNLPAWKFLSNSNTSPTCRILVGWDPSIFHLSCLQLSDQWVTCNVFSLTTKETFQITFVYGLNTPAGRSSLWNYITQQAPLLSSTPWLLLGDFNAILKSSDRAGGDPNWYGHQNDFDTCIQDTELIQLPYSGLKFTWHNGQLGGNSIMKKLDWIFANHSLLLKWPLAHYKVLPRDHSDHSAMILEFQPHLQRPPASSFKFLNFWADREDFLDIVRTIWHTPSSGNPIYSFTSKLQALKHALKNLHRHNSNHISTRMADAKAAWTATQVMLDSSPTIPDLITSERDKAKLFARLSKDEEAFYRQRSRIQWLHLGDRNTKFFHRSLLHRQSRNRIHALADEAGHIIHDQNDLGHLVVRYYQNLLTAPPQPDEDISRLYSSLISPAQQSGLEQPVTNEEIKAALFSIPDDKACWETKAIGGHRSKGKQKKEQRRGRSLGQPELLHNHHLNKGPARCALKIDLKKAFDIISWQFIIKGLQCIGLPERMITWIRACISSAFFSVGINGSLHGFFPSSRGLRQGDPLSPYLFVIAMEGLGGMLRLVAQNPSFKFHWRCKQNSITHLAFADDLMVFCHADLASVELIRGALDSFASISGLIINHRKSSVFLSGVEDSIGLAITNCLQFQLGVLPVKYLGVPLISSRLSRQHCTLLVERIVSRIRLWTSASLTYAGRLQLIKSTLFSIQVYWSSLFILPTFIIRRIKGIFAAFIWKGTSLTPTGAKVAWASLCYPKSEGGLGIKRIKDWNKAAILKLVWRILTESSSVWVSWIHSTLLRGRCFWFYTAPSSSTWSWRKLLLSRTWSKGYFVPFIGNGRHTFLWLDYWLPSGRRLCDLLPFRLLSSTHLPWNAKVAEIISGGIWAFPEGHVDLLPF